MFVIKKIMPMAIAIALVSPLSVNAADNQLETQAQKYSYIIGLKVGDLVGDNIDIFAVMLGINDQLKGYKKRLNTAEIQEVLIEKNRTDAKNKQAQDKIKAETNAAKGAAFLAKNKTIEGITTLDNGLQYKVVTAGTGESPKLADSVTVHYEGRLINGTVFDSSIKRGKPASFSLKGVVAGFREALLRMKKGSKWTVYMPSDLAYGSRAVGNQIGPNSTLIFDMELISIAGAKTAAVDPAAAFKAALAAKRKDTVATKVDPAAEKAHRDAAAAFKAAILKAQQKAAEAAK